MVTRAIDPLACPVSTSVPGTRNAAPTATTAPMTSRMAKTRQKVSLRRIRRRSTMVSASSAMAHLLDDQWNGQCRRPPPWSMARTKRPQLWQTRRTAAAAHAPPPDACVIESSATCRLTPSGLQRRRRVRRQCATSESDLAGTLPIPFLGWLFGRPLERGAEDVAERRAGIGRAVLRDRLLLLGHFERLDRDLYLVGAAVELGDRGRRPSGRPAKRSGRCSPRSRARSERLMKVVRSVPTIFTSRPRLLHLGHFAGDDRSLLEVAGRLR